MLRWLWIVFWIVLTCWMFTYSMYISFGYALLMLWCFLPRDKPKGWKGIVIIGFSPMVIWNVGLVEYGLKTIDLHCRVIGYFSTLKSAKIDTPEFCSYQPEAFERGAQTIDGPLLTPMEHIGVHGFNVMLATGGALVGLREVAWETLYLSFAGDPVVSGIVNEPREIRQNQCFGKFSQKTSVSYGRGDWLFRSSTVRQMVAKNLRKAKKVTEGKPKKFRSKKLQFTTSGSYTNNNGYYGELAQKENLRVPLALVVPDGFLHQEAVYTDEGPMIDVTWSGTISYPPNSKFEFPLSTVFQLPGLQGITGQTKDFPLLLSEGIFCGMAVDGKMNPYTQEWSTKISTDDPRLSQDGKMVSVQGFLEATLATVLD
jgi:hypothetical protein